MTPLDSTPFNISLPVSVGAPSRRFPPYTSWRLLKDNWVELFDCLPTESVYTKTDEKSTPIVGLYIY